MSGKSLVRVHHPNGTVAEVFTNCYHIRILDELPQLFDTAVLARISGTSFFFELNVSSKDHIFIARESQLPFGRFACVIDVFAVEGDPGNRLTSEEVFNRAVLTFEDEFVAEDEGSLTAYTYNENETYCGPNNGFPCGCIFTINSFNVSPSSSSLSSSYSDDDVAHWPREVPSIPANNHLMNPTPVENDDDDGFKGAPTRKGQLCHESPRVREDPYAGFRKSVGYSDQHLQLTGDLVTDPVSDKCDETHSRFDITVKDHDDRSGGGGGGGDDDGDDDEVSVVSPREESSLSGENSASSEDTEDGDGGATFGSKLSGIGAMVTGHLPTRPASLNPLQRRRSLQVNSSMPCEGHRSRTLSDVGNICNPRQSIPEDISSPNFASDQKNIPFLRSISGPPTTPIHDSSPPLFRHDPTRAEREGSEEDRGKNEFVVGTNVQKQPNINHSEQRELLPSPSNIAVVLISGADEVKEPQHDAEEEEEEEEREVPVLIEAGRDMGEEVPAIEVHGVLGEPAEHVLAAKPVLYIGESRKSSSEEGEKEEDWSDEDKTLATSSDQEEEPEVLDQITFHQVHLLEHACNDKCVLDFCPSESDPAFSEQLKQMRALVANLVEGSNDGDMKMYIRFHCSRYCPGKGCKVPHLAAGCPPPSVPSSPLSHSLQSCAKGNTDVSFDLQAAFDSTTPETKEDVAVKPCTPLLPQQLGDCRTAAPTSGPYRNPQSVKRYPQRIFSPFGQRTLSPLVSEALDSPGRSELGRINPLCANDQPRITPTQRMGQQISGQQEGMGSGKLVYQVYDRDKKARFLSQTGRTQPDVYRHGFPEYTRFKTMQAGTIMYSQKRTSDILMPGTVLPLPSDRVAIGNGGNGGVYGHYVSNKEFAVKKTGYRPAELNAWKQLDHPNLVTLQAVMVGKPDIKSGKTLCYQFMERMTDNLTNMVRKIGYLDKLSKEEDPVVSDNVRHVLSSVIKALAYLDRHNIQHCDVKGTNILIKVPTSCTCPDILHCTCPEDVKYQVKLADFDSIKQARFHRSSRTLPDVECQLKTLEQMRKVMGTPAYRAIEQFCSPVCAHYLLENTLVNGVTTTDLEGPWCDIWSLGVVILRISLGPDTEEAKHKANILNGQPHRKDLHTLVEAIHAQIKLKTLCKAAANESKKNGILTSLANLADQCLEINFRERVLAKDLLSYQWMQ